MTMREMAQVQVDEWSTPRPWEEDDLVTDWSAFPAGYGILLNERLMFPHDLGVWRMKIDTKRQLFVDDYLIADKQGLKREFHSPKDHPANPLITDCVPGYVGEDDEHGYRLYYSSIRHGTSVAFSRDGLQWDKPDLGVMEPPSDAGHDSGAPDNLVANTGFDGVFHEPDDPDESQRWKAIGLGSTRVTSPYAKALPRPARIWHPDAKTQPVPQPAETLRATLHDLYVSPDGIRWRRKTATSLPKGEGEFHAPYGRPIGIGDVLRVRWDPILEKYIANTKHFVGPDLRMSPIFHHQRVQAMCESDDLVHWSGPRIYASPDGEDAKLPGAYGIYEADGFPYESMWLNHFSMSWYVPVTEEESRRRKLIVTRPFIKRNSIRLAASRDGRHWYYLGDRRPFIDLGAEGSWKPHYLRMANRHTIGGPLLKDDQLWFYYRGTNTDGVKSTWVPSMGVAILRRDGFASLNAGENAAKVITRPMVFGGRGELLVNADVARGGYVRASVLDEAGDEIDGFGSDDSGAVSADSTRSRLGWSGHDDLAGLKDRYVRLAFHLKNAKLYSFWIE